MSETRTPADVQADLDASGLGIRVQNVAQTTATAQQAAGALGTSLGSILKSLCFLIDGAPVLVLVSGDKRVDDRKLASYFGVSRRRIRIADAETTVRDGLRGRRFPLCHLPRGA